MGLWQRLLDNISPPGAEDPDLAEALERAAYRVEPLLKQCRGWPKRYVRSIAGALVQARRVAAGIPGPVTLDSEQYSRNPAMHAWFGTSGAIGHLLRTSKAVHAYTETTLNTESFALLTALSHEKNSLGMDMEGEILRREVPQTQVWFTGHQLSCMAASEAETRDILLWALLDRFLERVAVGLERLRAERDRLIQEKDLAQARLRSAPRERRLELGKALDGVLKQLADISETLDPERLHEVFETVLSHPEDCLYLRTYHQHLDSLGIVREAGRAGAADIDFVELQERYQEPRNVVLVYCPSLPAADASARLDEAMGWLG